tara:strand:+ start:514 stop:693 length:180 start_codon:yes stop_codon:yes gene_type:complete
MFKNIYSAFKATYQNIDIGLYDNIDPNLVRYFKTEYGKNWEEALDFHLNQKKENVKKAA